MALLHHWTTETSTHIFRHSGLNTIWQITVPQVGFQSLFVLRAILALSALHLAHLNEDERNSRVATSAHHHSEGLQGFRHAVNHMTSENCESLFTWSVLNMMYVFASSKERVFRASEIECQQHQQQGHNAWGLGTHSSAAKDRILGLE